MKGRPGEMPQRLRTSARSAGVTVAWPWPRAYASTACTTIARAKAGIASRRVRAAASQARAKRDLEPEGLLDSEADQLAAVGARLVPAGRVLGEIVAVGRVRAAAAAAAELAELARAAPAAERARAEVGEDLRLLPQLGEARLAKVPCRHRHVRARRDVPGGRDAAVVLAGRARAVRVVGEQRRRRIQLVEDPPEVRRALRPDQEAARPAHRHAPGILAPLEDRWGLGARWARRRPAPAPAA